MSNEAKQAEGSNESMSWESIDINALSAKLNRDIDDLRNLRAGFEKLGSDGSGHSETKALLEKVRDKTLSSSGWMLSFYNENLSSFPQAKAGSKNPDSRPDWYYALLPDNKTLYDKLSGFMSDVTALKPLLEGTVKILTELKLEDTFRCILIKRHLSNEPCIKYDDNEYAAMNNDFKEFCAQMRTSWDELESGASKSRQYYAENQGKQDPAALKDGYIQARKHDYNSMLKNRVFFSKLSYVNNGLYTLNQNVATRMSVYDKYSKKLVELKSSGFEEDLKALIKDIDTLQDQVSKSISFKTDIAGSYKLALSVMLTALLFFANTSLEYYQKFKQADAEAPYCLMKQLDALTSAPSDFGFSPKKDDPWNGGTALQEAYKQACVAITLQCREFVNKRGKLSK